MTTLRADSRATLGDGMELIYSPDERGWYWQRFSDWKTTQLFATKELAIRARDDKILEWG